MAIAVNAGAALGIRIDVNQNAVEQCHDLAHLRLSAVRLLLERLSAFVEHGAIP